MNKTTALRSIKVTLGAMMALAACGAVAVPASAQAEAPQAPPVPSYATGEESIHGRIASFDGKFNLQLRDDRGFLDNVNLHQGTIINPTGLRLASGELVTILGHNTGKTFEANEIDTPYGRYPRRFAYVPAPYYGPYWAGYYRPYYAGPWYGYRAYPAFGVGFRTGYFGFRGWF